MKKNFWIRNIILAILLIVIIGGVSYYFIKKNGRKYEIEKVENYNYFVLKQNRILKIYPDIFINISLFIYYFVLTK